jgi:isoaspartyl peptidase/L-asparaginase-like protein (Ntn-hydrolase superfamily)
MKSPELEVPAAIDPVSGLFMKKAGRVGDSPLSGSGFYVDSEIGGAAATGLGEDLMKGCLCEKAPAFP